MRILLDQGIFDMRNIGQNALLQVAYDRIQKLWPDAAIGVTTFAPNLLKLYFPKAIPVSPDGGHSWHNRVGMPGKLREIIPPAALRWLMESREALWHRYPSLASISPRDGVKSLLRSKMNRLDPDTGASVEDSPVDKTDYTEVVSGYDLMIATGSQYLTDIARDAGIAVLDRLDTAIQLGIPTAMVGQGIGPIEDEEMQLRARDVLPRVDLICVRERLIAPKLLASFGVDLEKVFITGDDAIELAFNARSSRIGDSIGVSLRVMSYTEVGDVQLSVIGKALREAAERYRAKLVGLPISMSIHERDDRVIHNLFAHSRSFSMGRSIFPTPSEMIKRTQACRIVVTGTFHAALFALAQGIPAVCLARAASYINKLSGLADLFQPGCILVDLGETDFPERLSEAIDLAWRSADAWRHGLLEAAEHQIQWGYQAYSRIFDLVESESRLKDQERTLL